MDLVGGTNGYRRARRERDRVLVRHARVLDRPVLGALDVGVEEQTKRVGAHHRAAAAVGGPAGLAPVHTIAQAPNTTHAGIARRPVTALRIHAPVANPAAISSITASMAEALFPWPTRARRTISAICVSSV